MSANIGIMTWIVSVFLRFTIKWQTLIYLYICYVMMTGEQVTD